MKFEFYPRLEEYTVEDALKMNVCNFESFSVYRELSSKIRFQNIAKPNHPI